MKSTYIAIIIVAIIAVAGVGVYFMTAGNSGDDCIRTDLKVGDYVEFELSVHNTETEVHEDLPVEDFLTGYLYRDTSGFEKSGVETIKFKGQDIVCDIYKQTSEEGEFAMYVGQTSGVFFKMISKSTAMAGTLELVDTNLDVTKTIDEQVVSNGSFVKAKNTILQDSEQTSTISDYDGETCTVTDVVKIDSSRTNKFVIKSIDGDKIMTEIGIEFTKDTFLAFVSYEYAKKILESQHKVAYGQEYSETIDTGFGKKKVTVQEITYQDEFVKVTFTSYFGSNNVLYKATQNGTEEMTLKDTSLVKL